MMAIGGCTFNSSWILTLCALVIWTFLAESSPLSSKERGFSLFNLVSFSNSVCQSGNRNGTCYTNSECISRGGSVSGDICASGYGVCCIFSITCGGRSTENCTYLGEGSNTGPSCSFQICPKHSNICRVRFDFIRLQLADPVSSITDVGGSIGDCLTDSFSVTGDNNGSPVICGDNTGQHMILNADDSCNRALFSFGSNSNERAIDIKVTQFECGFETESSAGPPGCLQYFTGTTGVIENYGFTRNLMDLQIEGRITHLSNQDYDICIRRERGNCRVCYIPTVTGTTTGKDSYGLGPSSNGDEAKSQVNEGCKSDYIEILSGVSFATTNPFTVGAVNKICGRFFNLAADQIASVSVCSFALPFRIRFVTDADEEVLVSGDAIQNENKEQPRGSVGFSLNYKQFPC